MVLLGIKTTTIFAQKKLIGRKVAEPEKII